jgi:tocopherol O-methyltransferase
MASATQIQEHYDSLAFIYRAFWGDHIHHGLFETGKETPEEAQVALLDYCIRVAGLAGGEQVLDVGCGHGGTLLHLAAALGCSGTGITLSPKQARIANENARRAGLQERISVVVDDADRYAFPTGRFDLVWAMESTEHFAGKEKFLGNVAQALRPDGKLLLAAWTGSMQKPRIRQVAHAFLCPELWTTEEHAAAIKAAGLEILCCDDLSQKVARTWEICADHGLRRRAAVSLLPRSARTFVEGIPIMLDAYRSGDLRYMVMVAKRRG